VRPSAPPNPRAGIGHSPALDQRNAAAARTAARPPIAPAAPGATIAADKRSYEQKRFAQDQAAGRIGR
jgi:hypothetical protein